VIRVSTHARFGLSIARRRAWRVDHSLHAEGQETISPGIIVDAVTEVFSGRGIRRPRSAQEPRRAQDRRRVTHNGRLTFVLETSGASSRKSSEALSASGVV
jgi:hypothetical protein